MKIEPNKIYNCDCLEALKKMPSKSVDLVVTDPPYEFNNAIGGGAFGNNTRNYHAEYIALYHKTGKSKETERLRINANATKNIKRTGGRLLCNGFDFAILDECCRVLKAINIYVWCSKAQLNKLLTYFTEKDCFVDVLVWCKTNPTPLCCGTYLSDIEYLVFAKEKGVKLYGNYHSKHKYWVSPCNKADKDKYKHPTIKPLEIIKTIITNSSKANDVVLDPFIGSGTTAVACIQEQRQYIGFEIDKKYFEIANHRIDSL